MADPDYKILPVEIAQAFLEKCYPGSRPVAIRLAAGSYSNYTHILTGRDVHNSEFKLAVRRHQIFGSYDRGQKARREWVVLQCVRRNGIPAPQPVFLDEGGDVLGIPGLVTRYVPGEHIDAPADPLAWARSLAETLAMIHAVTCDLETRSLLLDANTEATWFLRTGSVPNFMQTHPDGARVWQTVSRNCPALQPVQPTLVHLDYWPGNILWQGDKISAVVDWEEAAFGDPAIDVAYCRMDMCLSGLPQAAGEFLRAYETASGHPLANLGFWELAAAARPMFSPQGWIDQSPQKERFSQFIAQAEERLREKSIQP